jgi:hypothetical protein
MQSPRGPSGILTQPRLYGTSKPVPKHSSIRATPSIGWVLALSGVVGEHVFGPRPFLGEIVTLVDGGDTRSFVG